LKTPASPSLRRRGWGRPVARGLQSRRFRRFRLRRLRRIRLLHFVREPVCQGDGSRGKGGLLPLGRRPSRLLGLFRGSRAGNRDRRGGGGGVAVEHGQNVRARGVGGSLGRGLHRDVAACAGRPWFRRNRRGLASVKVRHEVSPKPGHGRCSTHVVRLLRRRNKGVDHQVTLASERLRHRRFRGRRTVGLSLHLRTQFSRLVFSRDLSLVSRLRASHASVVSYPRPTSLYVSCHTSGDAHTRFHRRTRQAVCL